MFIMNRAAREDFGDMQKRAALDALTKLFNKALDGSLHKQVAQLWTMSRAALIPKTDGSGGWRPLGIGEAWYRLLGRIIIAQESAKIGAALMPLQLAVGIEGGCSDGTGDYGPRQGE